MECSSSARWWQYFSDHVTLNLATVPCNLVISRLDYCNILNYMLLPLKMVWKLELVPGASRPQLVTPILLEIHWVPVPFCTQFSVLLVICKAQFRLGLGHRKEYLPHY